MRHEIRRRSNEWRDHRAAIDCKRYLNKEQQSAFISTLTRCNHKSWSPARTRTRPRSTLPGARIQLFTIVIVFGTMEP